MSLAVNDAVTRVLSVALDGVTARQQVTANNIANVDTPNFRASSLDFESSLRDAVESGDITDTSSGDVTYSTEATDTPVGANGNNVDLRKETLSAAQSQYQYQLLSRAVNDQFTVIKDAIGTGA
ncbi:flagellar basal body rod protein FlgB [Nocardioides mangrovicus]|uniref:Flagellar basal body rod protein FlgB n=1 Tax=Nocardioides mangrovicus TaxID=2478913 RepID=A0A3L8P1T6_9ACTN|nr:flagellar basal body rod protein FlgB [Nocardioides mangrovicus]RLV48783.1 flagellar basal body rod protein FlgB [Nocardioides mangrovicus]